MAEFRVGDTVVCVDSPLTERGYSGLVPVLGATYVVSVVENGFLGLLEFGEKQGEWKAERFRLSTTEEAQSARNAENHAAYAAIDKLCKTIHSSNLAAGWWDQAHNDLVVPTKLALIHSELSEAMEGHRRGLKDDKLPQFDMIAVELADVLIRVFDLAGFLDIPLGSIIAAKEAYNAQRDDHKPENRQKAGGKKY
jgi:NTP pyrophosphatase (non-canonical NTP hydrolase)